jgi:hypothetical protein
MPRWRRAWRDGTRFGESTTALVFDFLWQALQTNGWPDEKLVQLQ